jgi:periplasmic protein TonB
LHASFIRLNTGGPDLSEDAIAPVLASSSTGTLSIALTVSLVVHAVLLLIHFKFPDASPFKDTSPTIEVVLVNSKSAKRPAKVDALAQVDLDGGGNTEAQRRAKSNLPAVPDMPEDAELSLAAQRVQQLEIDARRLLAQDNAANYATDPKTMPVEQTEKTDADKVADLPNDRLEIARLEAQIAREWEAYQQLPKRKFIGARTKGVVYAEYVDQWRQKIERVGTANFPDQARRESLFGNVLVTVAIKADGTVERVEIDRSSGSRVLDAAVERIVMLAAPFKPFPANVRREADILHITRNWSFTRSDLLLQ